MDFGAEILCIQSAHTRPLHNLHCTIEQCVALRGAHAGQTHPSSAPPCPCFSLVPWLRQGGTLLRRGLPTAWLEEGFRYEREVAHSYGVIVLQFC